MLVFSTAWLGWSFFTERQFVFATFCFIGAACMPYFIYNEFKQIFIDTEKRIVTFEAFPFRTIKKYSFDYFEGYVESTVDSKGNPDGFSEDYRCYYLIKNRRVKYKLTGVEYDNIDEVEEGIAHSLFGISGKYVFAIFENKT